MSLTPGRFIERFAGLKALVIGEAMLDRYLHGETERLCREAPVPIVDVVRRVDVPGGAANTAVNARRLGAGVTFLSVVGADAEGRALRQALEEQGVATGALVADPARSTLAKQRLLAGRQMLVRFDQGSTGTLSAGRERALVSRLMELVPAHDVVLVSDYAYGILAPRAIAALARCQARAARVIVVDSKRLGAYRTVGVTAVKPNFAEAVALLGGADRRVEARIELVSRHGRRLLEATGAQIAAVTLDTEGALFFERGRPPYRTYARPADHARAAGAGDTFVATLGLALAAGADLSAAAELASAAAAVVVNQDGTAACTAAELRAAVEPCDKVIGDLEELAARLGAHRRTGRRIVMTNGCFDILHRGHITSLNGAKSLGDVLVVGVNADASVQRLKGPGRPINRLEDRVQVLAALSAIDYIVPFDDDTPVDLVRVVRPDVFVKGGDYTAERLPEAGVVKALGGVVDILPWVEDQSTTSIIERIHEQFVNGAGRPSPLGKIA
jgi:D-beta-D-heptose 7-phosphate kinase/D-beta-D-heptose 1-phosphate adenosyltransferase